MLIKEIELACSFSILIFFYNLWLKKEPCLDKNPARAAKCLAGNESIDVGRD
jgi:hypothetical protein